jgi:heme-degrading monooxygenase HmoA
MNDNTQDIWESACPSDAAFVAINYITCQPEYRERFEELFSTRAMAIDRMPGFCGMQVLRPEARGDAEVKDGAYLIVSFWRSDKDFEGWVGSPEFREGHKRGFEDVRKAKEAGEEPPMSSTFQVYKVIAR